ncbi:NAD-dependent epimerase [Pseudomonadales bacterium]|nr:NAD-dependent epimerase [Pseudomonadales bacterium]
MYLVTGTAGFIGCEVALKLLEQGYEVVGVDSVNDYYDQDLKHARLARLTGFANYHNEEFCLSNANKLDDVFVRYEISKVIHLAAQAGVRYSLENPRAYIDSNLVAFGNVLECCRHRAVGHLVYASSSSVYGANTKQPFSVSDNVDHPLSLYAATKKSNELMAHTYSHLYQLPTTGLRFFTVYGPWGRPDMAPIKFAHRIFAGQSIDVYNHGNHRRDFTYIDDIVEGVLRTAENIAQSNAMWSSDNPDAATSNAPYRIYNIGCNKPVHLLTFIELLEQAIGQQVEKNMLPMQPGDVPDTYANVDALVNDVGYQPNTSVEEGVKRFVEWYKSYYKN